VRTRKLSYPNFWLICLWLVIGFVLFLDVAPPHAKPYIGTVFIVDTIALVYTHLRSVFKKQKGAD